VCVCFSDGREGVGSGCVIYSGASNLLAIVRRAQPVGRGKELALETKPSGWNPSGIASWRPLSQDSWLDASLVMLFFL
jgi:hypothetical protein